MPHTGRHSTFYTNLAHGKYSDNYEALDDDYDYEDEDYYDEDQDEYVVQKPVTPQKTKAVAPAKGKGKAATATAPAPAPTQTEKKGKSTPAVGGVALHDEDVMLPVFRQLRPLVDTHVDDTTVKQAIRDANYDPDAAMMALLAVPGSEDTTTTKKDKDQGEEETKAHAEGLPPAKGGHGRSLVLGGGSEPADHAAQAPPTATTTEHHAHKNHGSHSCDHAVEITAEMKTKKTVTDDDGKSMLHLVFSGHVDSGKSTILGHLLVLLGEVDQRVVNKFENQCKSIGKASFQYAWVLDSSEEERRRGVTIDAAQQTFNTDSKHVVVLDAPGHKQFVLNMITSATQADVALLVVTCAVGEFEAGLNVGTLEHLIVLRTLGVSQIVVALNKMDSVQWDEERYEYCVMQLKGVLKQTRFRDEDIIGLCPVSGLTGANLIPGSKPKEASWYNGPSLIEIIDKVTPAERLVNYPLRATVSDAFKHTACCKIEAGTVKTGDQVLFMPANLKLSVKSIDKVGFGGVKQAKVGDAVEFTVNGELIGVGAGNICCPVKAPCPVAVGFEAHIQTFGTLQRALIPGTILTMSLHMVTTPVTVDTLISVMDKKGSWSKGFVKCVRKEQQAMILFKVDPSVAMELADDVRQLGRFVLRMDGEMAGGGFVKRIVHK